MRKRRKRTPMRRKIAGIAGRRMMSIIRTRTTWKSWLMPAISTKRNKNKATPSSVEIKKTCGEAKMVV